MRVNEYIEVDTSLAGAPARFVWRGTSYQVIAKPEPWLSRRPWWAESTPTRVPLNTIDLRMWRVEVVPFARDHGVGEATCDLCYEVSLGAWTLVNIWSDEFDQQLFA